jgi:hypothetical protein
MKTCYYAHSVALYGTPQESRDIEMLQKMFFVLNPSEAIHQEAYKTRGGMQYFKEIVQKCDLLAFRAHVDGKIGAGVATEIEWALAADLPVIELPTMMFARFLSIDSTKQYLKEIGQR